MSETNDRIKRLLTDVLRSALVPNFLLVSFLVLIHWILIIVWISMNYQTAEQYKIILVGLLGGSLPIWSYGIWGLRRFVIKTYRLIHEQFIRHWLKEYCDKIAYEIAHADYLEGLKEEAGSIINGFKIHVLNRAEKLPRLLRKIVQYILRKLGVNHQLEERIRMIRDKDVVAISDRIQHEISERLIDTSTQLIPGWIVWLIPINTILFIALWWL